MSEINYQQIDLFSDDYKTLQDLLEIVYKLNHTGGYYDNDRNKRISSDYQIEFYRDLAFIVQFSSEQDNNEKIIDNAIYLKEIKNGLYQIYEMDGKILGRFGNDKKHIDMVNELIGYMVKGEAFKK